MPLRALSDQGLQSRSSGRGDPALPRGLLDHRVDPRSALALHRPLGDILARALAVLAHRLAVDRPDGVLGEGVDFRDRVDPPASAVPDQPLVPRMDVPDAVAERPDHPLPVAHVCLVELLLAEADDRAGGSADFGGGQLLPSMPVAVGRRALGRVIERRDDLQGVANRGRPVIRPVGPLAPLAEHGPVDDPLDPGGVGTDPERDLAGELEIGFARAGKARDVARIEGFELAPVLR